MSPLRALPPRAARRVLLVALLAALVGSGAAPAHASSAPRPAYLAVDPVRVASGVQLAAGGRTTVTLPGVPAGATTVALNVTGTRATAATALRVCAGTTTATCVDGPVVAGDGGAVPAFVLAPLGGANGTQVTIANGGSAVTIFADLLGFAVPTTADPAPGASLVPRAATRVMANQKVGSRARVLLTLPSVPARASAVVLTIAATGATSATYVSACPASQPPSSCQKTSTLNPAPGRDRQNFAVVALTPGTPTSIQLYNNAGTVALSVDVQGYFVAGGPTGSAGRLTPVHPVTVSAAAPLASSAPRTLTLADAPRGATAVYLGVTGTGGTSTASVAACPGTAATSACSSTTVLRTNARARSANVALVPLGGTLANQVTLFTSGATPVIEARVHGWVLPDPTRPTASTTGVPAGRTLTVHRGDIVVTTPRTVIDSRDVYGVIDVRADDVVIKNTRIRGRTAAYYTALVTNRGGRNLTVVDSELRADVESPYLYGILGSNFTAERVNIHRVIDAVHVTGPNVTVRASYLHDASHFDADPNFGGTPSHDDNIQIQAGYNIRITGNTIEGAWNAAVQITQDAGITNDVRLDGNWLDGGRCTVNVAEKNRGPIQGLVLDGNVFGRSTRVYDCAVVAPTTTVITNVDNVFTDGTPIRIRKA